MKNITPVSELLSHCLRLLSAVIVCGVLSATAGRAAPNTKPAEANLVANGSLETPNATGDYAAGWNKAKGGKTSWLAEEGDHFIRLEAVEANKMVAIYNQLPLQGAAALELTVKVRVTGLIRGGQSWFDARIMTKFCDVNGVEIKGGAKNIAFGKNTEGWVEKKVVMTVPAGATFIAIMPTLLNVEAGTMDLTEVKLLAVEPPAPVAPTT